MCASFIIGENSNINICKGTQRFVEYLETVTDYQKSKSKYHLRSCFQLQIIHPCEVFWPCRGIGSERLAIISSFREPVLGTSSYSGNWLTFLFFLELSTGFHFLAQVFSRVCVDCWNEFKWRRPDPG
jgi:hypothetical protein